MCGKNITWSPLIYKVRDQYNKKHMICKECGRYINIKGGYGKAIQYDKETRTLSLVSAKDIVKDVETKEKSGVKNFIQKYKWWIVGVAVFLVLISALGGGSGGGNGITTCKNCGRSEVVLFGYCEKCADDFLEWQKKQK